MSIAGLIVLLVFSIAVLLVIALPFARVNPDTQRRMLDRQRERAVAYYERALMNVRDLDEDFATGKINEDEYRAERDLWSSRGARILQLFDELDHQRPIVDDASADDAEIDAVIEEAVRAVRVAQGGAA